MQCGVGCPALLSHAFMTAHVLTSQRAEQRQVTGVCPLSHLSTLFLVLFVALATVWHRMKCDYDIALWIIRGNKSSGGRKRWKFEHGGHGKVKREGDGKGGGGRGDIMFVFCLLLLLLYDIK